MSALPTALTFEDTLRLDAEKTARRTLQYRFGRLSNRRIIATLRASIDADAYAEQPDDELLERWFAVYETSLRRLQVHRA